MGAGQGQLLLLQASIVAPAHLVLQAQCGAQPILCIGRQITAIAIERGIGGRQVEGARALRLGLDCVDQAMHRIRAIARRPRPAYDFDRASGFVVQLQQAVGIAEGRRAHRHAIFEDQETALPCPARQHGRADRNEVFLAGIGVDVDAGKQIQDFSRVVGEGRCDFGLVQHGIAARVRLSPVGIDKHRLKDFGRCLGRRGPGNPGAQRAKNHNISQN